MGQKTTCEMAILPFRCLVAEGLQAIKVLSLDQRNTNHLLHSNS